MSTLFTLTQYDHPADIDRIRGVLWAKGIDASREEAAVLWSEVSAEVSAGWLRMTSDTDDEIWLKIEPLIEVKYL